MSYNDALRQVLAEHLTDRAAIYGQTTVIKPHDIVGIDCNWDNGGNYDPTYPSELTAPTFEFHVRLRAGVSVPYQVNTVGVSFMFGALLNLLLGTEL
jgi:hypothetical protein